MNKPQTASMLSQTPNFWGFVAALAMIIGICGASLGPQMSTKRVRQITDEISNLPRHKRASIERNLDAYLALSQAEKMRYWEMHYEVESHALTPLLEDYNNWLNTLSPFHRQALRTRTEPAAKIADVEAILESQQKVKEQRLPGLIARIILQESRNQSSSYRTLNSFLRPEEAFNFENLYILSEAQLNTFINEVLYDQLSVTHKKTIDSETLQGIKRMFKILKASIDQSNNPRDYWPSDAVFSSLENQGITLKLVDVPNANRIIMRKKNFGNKTENSPGNTSQNNGFRKRIAFRKILIRSLMIYEIQQYESQHPVTDNNLMTFFSKLDTSKQAALLDSPASYSAEALKWFYIWDASRKESVFSDAKLMDPILRKLMFGNRGPGRGSNSNGDRPRGPRSVPPER